jgi:hypothetical protein
MIDITLGFPSAAPAVLPSLCESTGVVSSSEFDMVNEVSHRDNMGIAFSSSPGISGTGRNQKRHPDGVLDIFFSARLRIEVSMRMLNRDFDVRAIEK